MSTFQAGRGLNEAKSGIEALQLMIFDMMLLENVVR